jgi:hypothetical protein
MKIVQRLNKAILWAILLCAVLVVPCAARMTTVVVGGSVPAAGGATYACDSRTDSDKLCEDFQSTGTCGTGESYCRNTWTVGETGGTVVVGTMGGTNPCTDKGTRSVAITKTNTTTLEDLGLNYVVGTNSRLYISGMFRLISGFSTGNFPSIMGVSSGDPNWTGVINIAINTATGNPRLYTSVGAGYSSCGTTDISTGSWNEISVDARSGGDGTSTVYLNGTSQCTVTGGTANLGTVSFGSYDTDANYSYEIGTIKIDVTAMPDACAGN